MEELLSGNGNYCAKAIVTSSSLVVAIYELVFIRKGMKRNKSNRNYTNNCGDKH